ncbi:hypothetical protein PVL29_000965 [Vitis rotundifolia]|uniref:Uncharacterized protein n=1 Tax=Vitis rotundifolia TaxID=103349 RepID=A0AA39AKM0_VITRO|nr:hypothetical protein PVL29_000965 [Vitis rotundifolia]
MQSQFSSGKGSNKRQPYRKLSHYVDWLSPGSASNNLIQCALRAHLVVVCNLSSLERSCLSPNHVWSHVGSQSYVYQDVREVRM